MAKIVIDRGTLIVETEQPDTHWRSCIEIPIAHVEGASIDRALARRCACVATDDDGDLGFLHIASLAGNGEQVVCAVHDCERAISIRLRNERFTRLVVDVDDPDDALTAIEHAIRREQLPASTLAFLLGALESDETLSAAIEGLWKTSVRAQVAPAGANLLDVARDALGDSAFAGAMAAGQAASRDVLRDLRPRLAGQPERSVTTVHHHPMINARLSARERQVLERLAEGNSNQQIAVKLDIAERTARYHVTSIFNKLGADNRTHAVALAAQMGLLNLGLFA